MNQPPAVPPGRADDDYRTFPVGMQRAAAASGIAFVVLLVISIFFDPSDWPDFADSGEEYRQFALDNRDDMQVGQVFGSLGLFAFVWFVAYVRGTFARVEMHLRGYTRGADVFFAGGLIASALILTATMATTAAVSEPDDTDGAIIRALMHASDALWGGAILGFAIMLVAAGVLTLRTRALPVWTGYAALVSALSYLVLFVVTLPSADNIDDAPLDFLWFPGFLLLMIWVLATSIVLVRRVGKPWPWPQIRGASAPAAAPPPDAP